MLIGLSVSSFADSELTIGSSNDLSTEEGLFIESYMVPDDVVEYAKGFFRDISLSDLEAMDLNVNIDDLYLSHGFTVTTIEKMFLTISIAFLY